jgi:hypothetical protein
MKGSVSERKSVVGGIGEAREGCSGVDVEADVCEMSESWGSSGGAVGVIWEDGGKMCAACSDMKSLSEADKEL